MLKVVPSVIASAAMALSGVAGTALKLYSSK